MSSLKRHRRARRRVDGRAKVTGQTRFADDLVLPRMLHCKLLRSHGAARAHRPHRRQRARALDGVHLVLTGDDLPDPLRHPAGQPGRARAVPRQGPLRRRSGRRGGRARRADGGEARRTSSTSTTSRCARSPTPEEAWRTAEPRIHDYGDEGQRPQGGRRSSSATSTRRFAERGPRVRGRLLLRGQHAPAHRAARGRGGARIRTASSSLWSSTQTPHYLHRALAKVLDDAGRAHPRDRDAERRRLRRQERSVQPRDRRREGGAAARPAGEDLPHARGGLLLPPRPPSRC